MNPFKTTIAAFALIATASAASAETNGVSLDGLAATPHRNAQDRTRLDSQPQDPTFSVDSLLGVILNWGTDRPEGDMNRDGRVNVDDLIHLIIG